MIRDHRVLGARFPSSAWSGLESGLYVFHRRPYSLESVHIKHRPRVRRGLEHFDVRPATRAQLLSQGWALNRSTMARQGRFDPEFGDRQRWEILLEAASVCSEISFPAAFAGQRLAAYMITCREGNWLHILHQMSRQEDLPNFPNHVLTYTVTKEAAEDETLDAVCYGYVPLFDAGGLHEYKLRFGYELVPHRSAIQLHPTLDRILKSRPAQAALRFARSLRPQNQRLETIETVMRGVRLSGPDGNPC